MNLTNIFKALANESRSQILEWLKNPRKYFNSGICSMESKGVDVDDVGVCVGLIQQKAKLSQSTVSLYLAMLENAGLIQSTRIGQWTYYKRNDKTIRELTTYLTRNL